MTAPIASERARRYLSDLAGKIAERDGRTRDDVLADLGLYESSPWGRTAQFPSKPLVSAAIDIAKHDLAS